MAPRQDLIHKLAWSVALKSTVVPVILVKHQHYF